MKLIPFFVILMALNLTACGGPTAPDSPDPSTYGQTIEGEVPGGRHDLNESKDRDSN